MKVLLTGGGTGGHIMPILAVIKKLKNENVDFLFIGPKSNFNKIIKKEGVKVKTINAGKLRRYLSIKNLFDTIKIPIGFIQSLYIIYNYKPDIVFSKGGYASVPPVLAAWIFRIPVITHESDTVPGLANKIVSKFASKIFVSFSDSKKYFVSNKIIYTGNPIREEILNGDKNKAKKIFDLKENIPTILIFGGSQGAKKINEMVLKILPKVLDGTQIIHVCGKNNYIELKNEIEKLNIKNKHRYKVYPFLTDKLKDAYALCNVVISRAGANSLSEIIALEKPGIIIPLSSSANDHQMENAKFFAEKGMVILIKEENLTVDIMIKELSKILRKDDFRANMIRKMNKHNSGEKNAVNLIA
ncbi:MAG: undecaprenyldiphospho-muramoylpentapeptide beta-N-acetylglucosaminyltransferase, partial [Candidatus Pacebacteria bacterium]|nr:undecaprenyldiphospho-muramoylpentapeptide beta-N-acetylglucosaminyltransferase [Candidatus Paceibacterota bacterium]